MTVFGLVWLSLLGYALLNNKTKMLVTLVLYSSIFQSSNVFVIGGQAIGPQIITSCIVALYFLIKKIMHGSFTVSKKLFSTNKILTFLFVYIVINSLIAGTTGLNILRLLQIGLYILCYFMLFDVAKSLNEDFVYRTLRNMSIFILVVGVFQVLCTTDIIPRYWFIRDIFWNDSAVDGAVVQFMWPYGKYFRFFSTYMEPSYFVGFSVGAIFYFLNYKTKRKDNYILIGALVLATILSFSSTGYGALLLAGIVYFAFSKERKIKILILIGGLLGFCVLYFGFYNILDSVIFSKMASGSATARNTWNLEAMMAFEGNKLFGVGYKNCRASSIIYTLLAELGIVGIVLYLFFIISIIVPIFTKKSQLRAGDEHIALVFAIIGVVMTQIIAVPDFDICTFWMWMNYLGLIIGRNTRKVNQI